MWRGFLLLTARYRSDARNRQVLQWSIRAWHAWLISMAMLVAWGCTKWLASFILSLWTLPSIKICSLRCLRVMSVERRSRLWYPPLYVYLIILHRRSMLAPTSSLVGMLVQMCLSSKTLAHHLWTRHHASFTAWMRQLSIYTALSKMLRHLTQDLVQCRMPMREWPFSQLWQQQHLVALVSRFYTWQQLCCITACRKRHCQSCTADSCHGQVMLVS